MTRRSRMETRSALLLLLLLAAAFVCIQSTPFPKENAQDVDRRVLPVAEGGRERSKSPRESQGGVESGARKASVAGTASRAQPMAEVTSIDGVHPTQQKQQVQKGKNVLVPKVQVMKVPKGGKGAKVQVMKKVAEGGVKVHALLKVPEGQKGVKVQVIKKVPEGQEGAEVRAARKDLEHEGVEKIPKAQVGRKSEKGNDVPKQQLKKSEKAHEQAKEPTNLEQPAVVVPFSDTGLLALELADVESAVRLPTEDGDDTHPSPATWTAKSRKGPGWSPIPSHECAAYKQHIKTIVQSGGWRQTSYKSDTWRRGFEGQYRRGTLGPLGQCWSASEWDCFVGRRPRWAPSAALMIQLRRYRRTWHRCRRLEPRSVLRARMLAQRRTKCRYLLWSPTEGVSIGTNIMSLASALAYAVVTDRVLLVDRLDMPLHLLFCDPFRHFIEDDPSAVGKEESSWFFPHAEEFGGQQFVSAGTNSVPSHTYFGNQAFDLTRPAPSLVTFHLQPGDDPAKLKNLFCAEFHSWARNASVVVTTASMYWAPIIRAIPRFRRIFDRLFPGGAVFGPIVHSLLRPSNRVWAQVTAFLLDPASSEFGASVLGSRNMELENRADPLESGFALPLGVGVQYGGDAAAGFEPTAGVKNSLGHIKDTLGGFSKVAAASLAAVDRADPMLADVQVVFAASDAGNRKSLKRHLSNMSWWNEGDKRLQGDGRVCSPKAAPAAKCLRVEVWSLSDGGVPGSEEREFVEMLCLGLASDVVLLSQRSSWGLVTQGYAVGEPVLLSKLRQATSPEGCVFPLLKNSTCASAGVEFLGSVMDVVTGVALLNCNDSTWAVLQHGLSWDKSFLSGLRSRALYY